MFTRLKSLWVGLILLFVILVGYMPAGLPFMPKAFFSDATLAHWPAAHYLRASVLERGEFPLWRETIIGGQPFAANPLNKTAYPFQIFALILEPALFLNGMIVLHLLLAGWGMWRWLYTLDLSDEAAAVGGLAYTLAPKALGHLGAGHIDVLYALAWWPWLMWGIMRLIQISSDKAGTDNLKTLLFHGLRVGVFAALLFLGDVRLSLFAFGFAALFAIWQIGQRRRWGRLLWFAPAAIAFLLLTLAVIIPLLSWQPFMNRGSLTLQDAGVQSLEMGQLIGLLLPPHNGTPETLTYLGLPVLLMTLIAIFAAPRKHLFWILMVVAAVIWSLGIHSFLWPLVVQIVPGLLWFRVPSRSWFVVVMCASVLAGYGGQVVMGSIERLRETGEIPRLAIKRLTIAGGAGASLFCGGFTLVMLSDLPATIGIGVIVVGLLLGVVLLLAFYGKLSPQQLAVALLLVVFIDLGWMGRQWLEWRGPDQWLTQQQPLVDRLQQIMADEDTSESRIYSPNYALEQQVAQANGLRLFGGVDPFQLTGVVRGIEAGSGIANEGYSVVQPPLTGIESDADIDRANCDLPLGEAERTVLASWGVRYIISRCPLDMPEANGQLIAALDVVDGTYIYANPEFTLAESAAGWPESEDLPDAATIERLNQTTSVAAIISGVSFILSLIFLWILRKHA